MQYAMKAEAGAVLHFMGKQLLAAIYFPRVSIANNNK